MTSTSLLVTALFIYIAGMAVLFYAIANLRPSYAMLSQGIVSTPGQQRLERAGVVILVIGWGIHCASIAMRAIETARVPLGNMYEYGSAIVLICMMVSLLVLHRQHRTVLAFTTFLCLLLMLSSLILYTEPGPLQPALKSKWLFIHVFTISSSSAILMVGFIANVLYLVKEHAERRVLALSEEELAAFGQEPGEPTRPTLYRDVESPVWYPIVPGVSLALFTWIVTAKPLVEAASLSEHAVNMVTTGNLLYIVGSGLGGALGGMLLWYSIPTLPKSQVLDDLAYKIMLFGFPLFTFGIAAGSIWAEIAWGRFWGWDPKETASFVTWLIFAAYLHARATTGWKGRKAALIMVVGFLALVFTYFMVNLVFVGKHSYAM